MNTWVKHYYRQYRRTGESASNALRYARIKDDFTTLESEGLVQLVLLPDDFGDALDYLDQNFYTDSREGRALAKRTRELVERDGVWGQVGQYRLSDEDEWQDADSIWGLVGYDNPNENCYTPDIMAATINAYHEAEMPVNLQL